MGRSAKLNLEQWPALAAVSLVALIGAVAIRRRKHFSVRGKSVIVTGGSRGLGLLMAEELLKRGARVVVAARDPRGLERALSHLAKAGRVFGMVCDVANPDDVHRLVEFTRHVSGRIDALINNAGVIQVGPMEEMTIEDFEEAMAIHYWGPLRLIQAVVPEMQARRQGRIVNISSIGGVVPAPHLLPYVGSKFALTGLSEGLHVELAKDNIVVTTVCPGLMRTGSPPQARFKGRHRKEYAWFSIADSLPPFAMSARRAARKIVRAMERGRPHLVLSGVAKLGARVHGVFPGAVCTVLGWVNRLLPRPGGVGSTARLGYESTSTLSPSALTLLSERAARETNEAWPSKSPR